MKVEKNVSIYVGETKEAGASSRSVLSGLRGPAADKKQSKSIFAGELGFENLQDKIAVKKKKAKEQAMRVVGEAWSGDKKIDRDLEERRQNVRTLQKDRAQIQETMQEIRTRQEEVAKKEGLYDSVSEHQKALDKDLQEYQRLLDKKTGELTAENQTIAGIRKERLKHSPMVKAEKQAEEIMEDASEEIVGMVIEESKEHIDEEQEKREEQSEKIKEEKEKQEKLQDKRAEEKKEREEFYEEMPVEEIIDLGKTKADIQKEVQKILEEMKLIAEDVKGAAVDREL